MKRRNYIIWEAIKQIIKEKELIIVFNKVKAHNGNNFNEIADKLAKQGTEAEIFNINYKNIKEIKYHAIWENIIIDRSNRKFLKITDKAKYFNQ